MSKTNKMQRSLDEKQHHVSKAIKKEHTDRSTKSIDRMLKNRRFEQFYDDLDHKRDKEYWDEQ